MWVLARGVVKHSEGQSYRQKYTPLSGWQIPWKWGFGGHFSFSALMGPGQPRREVTSVTHSYSPSRRETEWQGSCHQQRWEKHRFGVRIIVPHIPLFAIVISAVILLDKQTSEKMQWGVRIDLHRADNWTFNLFTSPNRYLGWHLLINGIIRCLICSSQKLITQPMVKP